MTQAEKIYMISDAAKQVEVEAHVLRYWEEELEIPTKRNEMGHRYYTEEDIMKFRRIKELKEQGLQLKAIRHMLKRGNLQSPILLFEKNAAGEDKEKEMQKMSEEQKIPDMTAGQGEVDMSTRHVVMVKKGEFLPVDGKTMTVQEESKEQKSIRLQQLLKEMIMEAVQSNNQDMCQEIKESLLKELDYQFRLQEEREDVREEERIRKQEEHYQRIDELLRVYNQRGRKGRKLRRDAAIKENVRKETAEEGEQDGQKEKGKNEAKGLFRKKRSVV